MNSEKPRSRFLFRFLSATGIVLLQTIFVSMGSAATTLTVVVDAVAAAKTPLYLAMDHNIFRKYGLEANVVSVRGGSLAAQTALGGGAEALDADEAAWMLAALQTGARLKAIGSLVNTFPFKVVGKPELADSPRNGRFGMSRFGSASDFSLRLFAKSKGLNPDKDIRILQVGGQPDRLAALQTGIIDASVFQEPEASIMVSKGFKMIHDFSKNPIPYPFTGYSATVSVLQNKRPAAVSYMKAMTEALYVYKCDKKAAMASMGKHLRTDRGLNDAYEMMLAFYPQNLSPNREALKAALAVFNDVRPDLAEKARTFDIESVVDDSVMHEVLADPGMKAFLGACK